MTDIVDKGRIIAYDMDIANSLGKRKNCEVKK